MKTPAVYLLVELNTDAEKADAFKGIAHEMSAGSRLEPGTLGYEWHSNEDGTRWRLVESYATAADLLAHFKGPVVQQLIPALLQHARVERFQVCGDPGAEGAAMLAGFGAEIFPRWQG